MTASMDGPVAVTALQGMIQPLYCLPRTWTPGCCVTLAGVRPLFASTLPGTWTTPTIRMMQALTLGALAQPPPATPRDLPTATWAPLRGPTLEAKVMGLVLREPKVGVEAWLLATSPALVGETHPTTRSPLVVLVAGETPHQEAPPPIYPRMVVSPGAKRKLAGMILTTSQSPRAGESNTKPPMAGAMVEEAVVEETGENQKKARRAVPPTLVGRERQEAGRRAPEAGESLLRDLGYLDLEEVGAGESQLASAPVALPKVGGASRRMGPVAVVEEGAWALGLVQAQ